MTTNRLTVGSSEFTVLIHEAEEGETGYWGEVIELPGCVSQGETIAELKVNIQEAIEAVLQDSATGALES